MKLINDIKLFLAWRDTTYRDFAEIHELCMLAARRCAHDLDHAAGDIWYSPFPKGETSEHYHAKARNYLKLFYPVEDQKNYRHDLHKKISQLETSQEKLCEILAKHGVPITEYEQYSPNGGIPF